MISFDSFICDIGGEACGACMGCQTRTIPGTSYLLKFNLLEEQLLEGLDRFPRLPSRKLLKLRGMNSFKLWKFRATGVVPATVNHTWADSPWESANISQDAFFAACDASNAALDAQYGDFDETSCDEDAPWVSLGMTEDEFYDSDDECDVYDVEVDTPAQHHFEVQAEEVDEPCAIHAIPHPGISCAAYQRQLDEHQAAVDARREDDHHCEEFQRMFPDMPAERYPEFKSGVAGVIRRMRGQHKMKSLTGKYFKLDRDVDVFFDSLETTLIFLHQYLTARDMTGRVVAICTQAKLLGEKLDNFNLIMAALQSAAEWYMPPKPAGMETQSAEEVFDTLQNLLDRFENLKSSQTYAKFYKFGAYALALSLFAPLGVTFDLFKFDKVTQEAMKKKYHMGPDFIHSMLDTALFLVRRGYQSYQAGSILPMFHSSDRYQMWHDEAEKLQRQSNFLSNPEAHGLDRFKFMADLKDVIEKGRSMKKCSVRKEDKVVISKMLASLELTHDLEVTKRAAQRDRKSPLAFLLYGGSGIGKSTLQDILFKHYGKVRGLQVAAEYRYVRNSSDKFWSGFNSTQWCVIMDDIAFLNPALGVLDPSLVEMLCVANNMAYVPLQAELSEKGRTPVLSELLLASTNTEDLNLHAYFSCPLAVQRRFPWVIDVSVRSEFQDPRRPGMLDSSRVPVTPAGQYPDFWRFTVKRVEPVGLERRGQKGKLVIEHVFDSMPAFLRWYNKVIVEHNIVQDKIVAGQAVSTETSLCPQCSLPMAWCDCVSPDATSGLGPQAASRLIEYAPLVGVPTYVKYTPAESMRSVLKTEGSSSRLAFLWYYHLYVLVYCTWLNYFVTLFLGEMWYVRMIARSPFKLALTRIMFGYAGKRVGNALSPHSAVIGKMGIAALAAFALYKVYGHHARSLLAGRVQGGVISSEEVKREPREYGDTWAYSREDLSQTSLCSRASDGKALLANLERSLYVFETNDTIKHRRTVACNLRGSVFMCNNHGIPPQTPFRLDIIVTSQQGMTRNMRQILVTSSMVTRFPDRDLAFLHLRVVPPGTDLIPWFAYASFVGRFQGEYMGRDSDGNVWRTAVENIVPGNERWASHGKLVEGDMWAGIAAKPTVVGDCGAILFTKSNAGWVLLGMHTLGDGHRVRALKLDGYELRQICDSIEPKPIARGGIKISAPSAHRELGELSAQSVIREQDGVGDVMGSFVNDFRKRGKTYVADTLIADLLVDQFGYTRTRTAPAMGRKPWAVALKDMVRPVVSLDMDVLGKAVDMYSRETCGPVQFRPYDLRIAINGLPGVEFCDKMPRKTSAGAPYKCSKQRFLIPLEGTDVDVVPEIKDSVREIIASYRRGERVHTVFCGQLKDEPVTFAKAEARKTRVFTMAGIAQTLVTRMYLLPLVVHMQKDRFRFEVGVGVCAQSAEWEEAYQYLTKFGTERMVAGDYAKFDKRMPASVILATFDIMLSICKTSGYDENDLAVVRGIAYDTAFPTVDFNGDLVEFYGSNPSGHALTVIVNSLANSLYMRYTYLMLRPPSEGRDFKALVALWTYGDDNVMGVSEEAPWFNHSAIQDTLAAVDIEYTMADKEAASVPYISISETSFLKRTWRWEEALGVHVAPLDLTSIEKMLLICVQKLNICAQAHAEQVLSTAVREYFFHGRAVFQLRSQQLKAVADQAGLANYVTSSTFPDWEQLCDDFATRSRHVGSFWAPTRTGWCSHQKGQETPQVSTTGACGLTSPAPLNTVPKTETARCANEGAQGSGSGPDLTPGVVPDAPLQSNWEVQADVMPLDPSATTSAMQQQTVTFHDSNLGTRGGIDVSLDPVVAVDQTRNMDLVEFLSRPVRIDTFTWGEADPIGTKRTLEPWHKFYSDARVKYKLNNFGFLQCKLKVKVLVNASPFYYGRMYMGYQPLPALTQDTIQLDAGLTHLIPYSQRPHIWIEPMNNAGGEMTLPFFYQQNWINAHSAQALKDQGKLTFINYTDLESANGVTGGGVTISVYAWAEDVKLSGPSAGLSVQSFEVQADEYGTGAVSGPASAVARAAGMLESIPFIGRFATATRMGAGAVAGIASLFGWTNVPVIADTAPVRPEAFPQFASSQIAYPTQQLTLDPKNELSVDPRVVGLPSVDELDIKHLATRASYLTRANWSTAGGVDTVLFSSRVNPIMFDTEAGANRRVYMTPMCWVSQLFGNWRGDIIFRFKVVASQFHKGRLIISFDPSGTSANNLLNETATSNVVFTSILDLAAENEVEFTVPYQQAISYLAKRTEEMSTTNLNWAVVGMVPGPSYNVDQAYDNGVITVRILTALTAPIASSSVALQVFVRAGDNFELANPTVPPRLTTWQVQSAEQPAVQQDVLGTSAGKDPESLSLVNFGESVRSLRQLMRRYSLVSVATPATAASSFTFFGRTFTKIPPMPGYDTVGGINTAKGLVATTTTYNYNFTFLTPTSYILPAFVAYRGSTNWSFNAASGNTPIESLRAYRLNSGTGWAIEASNGFASGTPSANAANFLTFSEGGAAGQALTNARTAAGLSVTTPMFTPYRFQSTAPGSYTRPRSTDGSDRDSTRLEVLLGSSTLASNATVWTYQGIGTDFNCHFFLNVPTYWYYTGPPVPV